MYMIPCITDDKLKAFHACIKQASRIAVVSHLHPDGDALGSSVAMGTFLRETMGKDVVCILPDAPPANIMFIIPDGLPFIYADTKQQEAEKAIQNSDLLILLDLNGPSRTEPLESCVRASSAKKILVDHHLNPEADAFDLVFSTPEISSASELLYWILKGLTGATEKLPEASRTALCAGMTTDTNNFANSVFPTTFTMASELIASGTDRDAIIGHLYNEYRENRIRLMGYMQSQKMVISPEGAARMILTKELQEQFGYREGETEGLVNVPLGIGKVRLSIILTEKGDKMRVSIRSKKGTSAQRLAAEYFHGGGHENAAGGKLVIGEDIPDAAAAEAYVDAALKEFLS